MTKQLNPAKLLMSTDMSSLKVLMEGSGHFDVAGLGGAGVVNGSVGITHNFGNDNLLYQVIIKVDGGESHMIPWSSNDGRLLLWGYLNGTNLTLLAENSDSSGYGTSGHGFDYTYRILIP